MPTRRTLMQGAASLIAPASGHWPTAAGGAASAFFRARIAEQRRLDDDLAGLMDALRKAEGDALEHGVDWDECPKIAAINAATRALFDGMDDVVRRAARRGAACLDDVVLKLVLWRLSDPEPECFSNACDMLSFSAYRDLLAHTGREALAHPADDRALKILWDDSAFVYD